MDKQIILNSQEIKSVIGDLSHKIFNDIKDIDKFAIVGVQTRGIEIARRIQQIIKDLSGKDIKNGVLDISFYRDDLATRGVLPAIKETRINFNITNLTILLVDDVIFTGRTTKAALETLMSFGRPKEIKLFTLIDRGNRELPIQPDYCGQKLQTRVTDYIDVLFQEVDNVEDVVYLCGEKP